MLMFPNHSNHAQALFVKARLFISCAKELFKIKAYSSIFVMCYLHFFILTAKTQSFKLKNVLLCTFSWEVWGF